MFDGIGYDFKKDGSGFGIKQFNHIPGGCNVLYMDGHVQFVRYNKGVNDQFPVTFVVAALGSGTNYRN